MEKAPITFEYKGNVYKGVFSPVKGSGEVNIWHLMIDGYYKGMLHYTDRWAFFGNDFEDMSDFFGDYITAWYQ